MEFVSTEKRDAPRTGILSQARIATEGHGVELDVRRSDADFQRRARAGVGGSGCTTGCGAPRAGKPPKVEGVSRLAA